MHFGHKKILEFSGQHRDGGSPEEHDELLIAKWNMQIKKRDLVHVLGDVAMSREVFHKVMPRLNGRKMLTRGNHDHLKASEYLQYFEDIRGIWTYKGHWVSHAPVHPAELRERRNIHGHVHHNTIRDHYHQPNPNYVNVCVEACDGFPVDFERIKENSYESRC
jgi:calcineurin-like phosphoesterase family protein